MARRHTYYHDFSTRPLGWHPPANREQVARFPALLSADRKRPTSVLHKVGVRYNQGTEGACVGMGVAAWCSAYDYALAAKGARYDALSIYNEAKKIDEYPGENYSGTSVDAGLQVARTIGAPRLGTTKHLWISEYRWAGTVEDILNHVAFIGPVVIGMDWYTNFDQPKAHSFGAGKRQNYFIGEGDLGTVRGGHCIALIGYYRNRAGTEWVMFQNSWGFDYPQVWMPVTTLQQLWAGGTMEAGLVTGPVREA